MGDINKPELVSSIGLKHVLDVDTDIVYLSDKKHHKTKRMKLSQSNQDYNNLNNIHSEIESNSFSDYNQIDKISSKESKSNQNLLKHAKTNSNLKNCVLPSNGNGSGSSCHQCKNCKDSLYYCSNNFVNKDHSSV